MKTLSLYLVGLLALWACYSPPTVQAECRVLTSPETYTAGQVVRDPCDAHGTRTVTLTDSNGNPSSVSTTGATATAAAPTYSEAATVTLSTDLAGNERVTLGTLLSGEDQTNNLLMTSGGSTRITQLVGTGGVPSTATDATTTATILPTGRKTFHGLVTCTGTCVQIQKIYGAQESSATVAKSVLVCILNPGASVATTTATDWCTTDLPFSYWFVVTSSTSGTTPLSAVMAMY